MDIIDLHADLGSDLFTHVSTLEEAINRFGTVHLPGLQQGGYRAVGGASFFDGQQDWPTMQATMMRFRRVLQNFPEDVVIIEKPDDFDDDRLGVVLTVEGMGGVIEAPAAAVDWMSRLGIKIASLQWSEENALSTGINGDLRRGLTPLGKQAVKALNENRVIIDVSHANVRSFYDMMSLTAGPIIATHSNCFALHSHPRNLTDEQIRLISEHGGVIGLVAVWPFLESSKSEDTIYRLAEHAAHIAEISSIEHVALGFDFMDYYGESNASANLKGLSTFSEAQNCVSVFKQYGFSNDDIQKITSLNAKRIVNSIL